MIRPRLKTSTGCQRCRIRRKKCDERRPVCSQCYRLNLSCTWLSADKISLQKAESASNKTTLIRPLRDIEINLVPSSRHQTAAIGKSLGEGYLPFQDQVHFDLTVQSSASLRELISQTANPEFKDTSFLITMALQNNWLRDALASFTAHTFSTQKNDRVQKKLAPTLYHSGVSKLRSHIEATQAGGGSIAILGAMIFLGMSDSLGTGDPIRAVTHFSAAAELCKTLSFSSAKTRGERMLYRIAVECWLYHLSTLSMFHEDCEVIMKCIDWTVLDDCFEGSSIGNYMSLHTSPFLGGMTRVYKLIMQMTWYARQDNPLKLRQQQKSIWSVELDLLQQQPQSYFLVLPVNTAQLYFSKFLLHIYALRIMLEKIADHNISNRAPLMCSYIKEAQLVFESSPNRERKNPALGWPIIIFLCAANEDLTFNFFVNTITEIYDNFDEGHRLRMNKVLDTIRKQRIKGNCALDLLLHKKGIFGVK